MEDIDMGRNLAAQPKTVSLTDGIPKAICGFDPMRTRLIVSGNGAFPVLLLPKDITTGLLAGLCLTAANPREILRVEDYGKQVTTVWTATANGGDVVLFVIEASLEKQ